MARRLLVIAVWVAAAIAVATAIGMRVRASRLADPVQALRPYLVSVPSGLGTHATLVERSRDAGGLTLQFELAAGAKEIRAFAAAQGLQPVDGALIGARAERWTGSPPRRPEVIVQLLLPDEGPALLTVLDPRPDPR